MVDVMIEIDYFIDLYINLKRNVLKNRFIKIPKDADKFIQDMTEVKEKIDALHADPIGYLQFMVKYYSPMRIFPSPRHLLSEKAVNKFRYHQALSNKFVYDYISFDKDNVFIHESMENVSYKNDISIPIDQDIRLKFAIHLSKQHGERVYTLKERNDIIYAISKLKYLEKPIPDELKQLKEAIDANSNL